MIRVLGLSDEVFKNITVHYDGVVAYENSKGNIIEFREYADITTCGDHIKITVTNGEFEENFNFLMCDYWRIEIE